MSESPTPVWDGPTRFFHWALAILVLVAWLTAGEQMTVHRGAGYAILGLVAFRVWWGFAGVHGAVLAVCSRAFSDPGLS